jgi:D-psicose/D-tagatose/L-ribulose 3-epimerase
VPIFRYAVCNEIFQGWSFTDSVKAAARAGFTGLEFAAFTLGEDPVALEPDRRREYRSMLASEGLQYAGMHWLLAAPKTLHITTPDKAHREWSWNYFRGLIDLSADLGPNGVMVLGSPRQRSAIGGLSPEEATRHLVEGLASVADHAGERGVILALEALSPEQTDVVTSLDEAAAIVREINHPAVQTLFDSHNAVDEKEPHAVLVDRHFDLIRHVHINEMDGRHPGTGSYDFLPLMQVLQRRGYAGWVSAEVFDFTPGPERIMAETMWHMESVTAKIKT